MFAQHVAVSRDAPLQNITETLNNVKRQTARFKPLVAEMVGLSDANVLLKCY